MQPQSNGTIWSLYLAGQLLHILKRAGMAVRSKSSSLNSRLEFIAFYWDSLLVRVVLCSSLFWVVLHNPRALTKLLAVLGSEVAADISINYGSALIFGYFADSVLDWLVSKIPILQRELPALNGTSSIRR